jgi:hypothetical protein
MYGATDRRRQLFVCRSAAGVHRFAEALPRSVLRKRASCSECLTDLDRTEGPPYPRGFEFPARLIARALVAVAAGESYRHAATRVRVAHRTKRGRAGVSAVYGANGTLVADWLEIFAPPIWEALGQTSWPPVIAVDDLPFAGTSRTTGAWPHRGKVKGGIDLFSILGAQGYPTRERGQPWFFLPSPSATADAWRSFFRSLDGRPSVIVGDAAPAWQLAARRVWPTATPELLVSEFHLSRVIEAHLVRLRIAELDPVWEIAREAFWDPAHWRELMADLAARGDARLGRFVRKYSERIERQITNHPRRHGVPADVPLSTGGIELVFRRELTRRLADRRGLFTNRQRLARLVLLMTLHMTDLADERQWAEIIRGYLLERGGRPPRARVIVDRVGTSSLLVRGHR